MTIDQQLNLDLEIYGVCYEYMIDGTRYRLDPRWVKKTELEK